MKSPASLGSVFAVVFFVGLVPDAGGCAEPENGRASQRPRLLVLTRGLYRDAEDCVGDTTSARATVWRWRQAFQNNFQARVDWCVMSPEDAHHAPMAVINGDHSRQVLESTAKPGSTVRLSAAGSSDPDDNSLSFHWWVYDEPGTWDGPVEIEDADQAVATLHVPQDTAGKTIHVILEITDDGLDIYNGRNVEWGNALEIGFELRTPQVENILWRDCDIIRVEDASDVRFIR